MTSQDLWFEDAADPDVEGIGVTEYDIVATRRTRPRRHAFVNHPATQDEQAPFGGDTDR